MEGIISKAHSEGKRIRVVGNALSPNGIGLSEDTMLSLGQCDRVLHVDKRARTVTVEVRVTVVTKAFMMQSRGWDMGFAPASEQAFECWKLFFVCLSSHVKFRCHICCDPSSFRL